MADPTSIGREADPTEDLSSKFDSRRTSQAQPEVSTTNETVKQNTKKKPFHLPASLQWIPNNFHWPQLKPVIRCATAGWISGLLFIIPQVEIFMGQASFLILIAAFLSPPSDPFMSVFEREIILLFFASLSWAWGCLGMKLAYLARKNRTSVASFPAVISGKYIEAGPTVIFGIFIFLGTVFLLYIKARQGPGPYLFATIFGCISLDIILTTAALFPYPFYTIGKAVLIPLSFHSAIAILSSILIFPSTMSTLFTARMQGVLAPLANCMTQHQQLLKTPLDSESFSYQGIRGSCNASEGALAPLAAAARLLKGDLVYSHISPDELKLLQKWVRRLSVRANGMITYFMLTDTSKNKFPVTPHLSRTGTAAAASASASRPTSSPVTTRPGSAGDGLTDLEREKTPLKVVTGPVDDQKHPEHHHRHHHHRSHRHSRRHSADTHTHSNLMHSSLLHLALSRTPRDESAVGVFESQRYLNLESNQLYDPNAIQYTDRTNALLSESCEELLGACRDTLLGITGWLGNVNKDRFSFWVAAEKRKTARDQKIVALEKIRDDLVVVRSRFKTEKRHAVLDPYRQLFDPRQNVSDSETTIDVPPHKYLFNCFVYQFHLMQFSILLGNLLDEIIQLEKARKAPKLWTPARRLFSWHSWEANDSMLHTDEENPDVIPGIEPSWEADLGMPLPRDPDVLPPTNFLESAVNAVYVSFTRLGHGNILFAFKAAILTILMCLPSFLPSSASFAYRNRFVWAIIMGQLTISRFRGDTTFGLVARVGSTFMGCLVGIVLWYISCGNGNGSPYGLAAVFAVCFPFFFYARIYWPVMPMVNIIFFVTAVLVVGYSYQDLHVILPGTPGVGWQVGWRRFLLVTVGVFVAFLFSLLPPSTTIRKYQRSTLATTVSQLASIYCATVSFTNDHNDNDKEEIITSLIAVRSKLKRSITGRQNVIYEFSLRGKWPAERYQKILELQLQIAYTLNHLMSVAERLEPAWSRAFLRRVRFLDADFQGDVLAVMSMVSTALRTGIPLPQITPCPLLDRFMVRHHGLNVIHQESEDDYGLPRTLTMETLQNEQYLIFCVGVSIAFTIVTRLDRLMVATKELVGEQYHIHGVGGTGGVDLENLGNEKAPEDV